MLEQTMDSLHTAFGAALVFLIQLGFSAAFLYFILHLLRALPAAGTWKVAKIVLTILFLPAVVVWKLATAGSDCGCCCDEDD